MMAVQTCLVEIQMGNRGGTLVNCTLVHQCSPCHCCMEYPSSAQNLVGKQLAWCKCLWIHSHVKYSVVLGFPAKQYAQWTFRSLRTMSFNQTLQLTCPNWDTNFCHSTAIQGLPDAKNSQNICLPVLVCKSSSLPKLCILSPVQEQGLVCWHPQQGIGLPDNLLLPNVHIDGGTSQPQLALCCKHRGGRLVYG